MGPVGGDGCTGISLREKPTLFIPWPPPACLFATLVATPECQYSTTEEEDEIPVIVHSDHAQQQKDKQDEQNQTDPAAAVIAKARTETESSKAKDENEDDQNNNHRAKCPLPMSWLKTQKNRPSAIRFTRGQGGLMAAIRKQTSATIRSKSPTVMLSPPVLRPGSWR